MTANAVPLPLSHGVWSDRPGYTGLAIRPDGVIALLIKGCGLILGPLSAEQVAEIGSRLQALAAHMHARDDKAAGQAMAELEELTAGSHDNY